MNRGSGLFRGPPERLVFCLSSSVRVWAASPPGRQHGVGASALATGIQQRGRDCLAVQGPSAVLARPWVCTQRPGKWLPAQCSTGVLSSSCDPAAQLFPN